MIETRKPNEIDYRVRYSAAKTASERRTILQKEINTAARTGTAVASMNDYKGVPLPEVFGSRAPTANRPAYYSLYNYIKAGFVFTGEGINNKDYAKENFSIVFEDWKTRFNMPLDW